MNKYLPKNSRMIIKKKITRPTRIKTNNHIPTYGILKFDCSESKKSIEPEEPVDKMMRVRI